VLREHALESGQGFDAATLLTNDRDLRAELAADLWRFHAQDSAGADDLAALWSGGFEDLSKDLPALLREPVLLPPVADDGLVAGIEAMQRDVLQAQAALQQAWNDAWRRLPGCARRRDRCRRDESRAATRQAWLADLRQWLQAFAHDPWLAGAPHPKLEKLTATALATGTKKGNADRTPASAPMSQAVSHYLDALLALDGLLVRRRGNLLHRLRDEARTRLSLLKRQRRVQTYDDLIDGVADALAHDEAGTLVRQLRSQYAVALVDEFQDTDARQWAIFDAVFGSGSAQPALFVIGDPKQAIYGFRGGDVHTYLAAAKVAASAPALSHNFRSRPAVLRAVAALYANAGDAAFIDPRIEFRAVEAGHARDDDFLRDGQPAPALTVWRAPKPPVDEKGKQKPWSAGESREFATQACVAAIHGVLSAARAGIALVEDEPVQPGDIAVLVRSHREATMIQQALALVGIAAVAAGKQSLFATGEARDVHVLLLALLHSGDDGRLRTALSTVLVGVDALGIDHLEADADAHRDWQQRAMGWRERLLRGGPLALINDLCAEPCRTPARPAGWRAAHQQLPATGRTAAGSAARCAGPARPGRLAGPAHRQRRCQRRGATAAPGIRCAPRADRHPAQEQGPGVSAGVPALRRHRRQAAVARAHCVVHDAASGRAACTGSWMCRKPGGMPPARPGSRSNAPRTRACSTSA
jgi:exodeoxyribonuclease V beta subunit